MESDSCRRDFPIFQKHPDLHYLDSAAMAQVPKQVVAAMAAFDLGGRANVQRGLYRLAEDATAAFAAARQTAADFLGARSSREIVFTAGATAAINLAAQSLGETLRPGDEIVLSQLEHHSNICPWQLAARHKGVIIKYLPATADAELDLTALEHVISERTRIVAVTHGSNVSGALTDLAAIARRTRAVGARLLVDGSQVVPHLPVDMQTLGADFYVLSGHKLYGPTGIGVLWGKEEALENLPVVTGGGGSILQVTEQNTVYAKPPAKFEGGTPPVSQAIGLAAAMTWLRQQRNNHSDPLENLTEQLLNTLARFPQLQVIGPRGSSGRLPVVSFQIPEVHPHDICQVLAEHQVAARGGHHCAQPLMAALGLSGTTRVSLGLYNRSQDIDALEQGLKTVIRLFCREPA